MARKEARIQAGIWGSSEWRALSADAQWMYFFLISQPDIAHDGVISLRESRWARNAGGLTVKDVRRRLEELERTNYVVLDDGTEELLVRSFMRNDQVFLQPNLMHSALSHLPGVESHRIRRALYSEVARIVRENGDRVRVEQGLDPLTEKQKTPIRRMVTDLRSTGDGPGELTSGDVRVQVPADDPSGNPSAGADPVVGEGSADDLRSLPDDLRSVTSVDDHGRRSDPDPSTGVDAEPTSAYAGYADNPSHNPPSDDDLRSNGVDLRSNPDDLRSPADDLRSLVGSNGGSVTQVDVTHDDPAVSRENTENPNPYANPLGDRGVVRTVSRYSPYPLFPDSLLRSNGHDLRSTSGDPLLDESFGEPQQGLSPRSRSGIQTTFERFWQTYPLKVKKSYARQCWDRAIRRAPPERIIAGAKRYAEDPNRAEEFTAHPSTWLNQGRWDDDPLPARVNGHSTSAAQGALDAAARRRASRTGGEITDGRR